MGVRKEPEVAVAELNKWLKIFTADNCKSENKTLHMKHNTEMTRFYSIKKSLIALGRLNSKKIVLTTKPISIEEFNTWKLIESGGLVREDTAEVKETPKKKRRKKRAPNGTGKPALAEALEIPAVKHSSEITVTINLPVKELVSCFLQMIRQGSIK
jgi:hypothetical protein